ncbi:aminodeoxychorismate/anthranilate synthase component II [Methanolobus zinderi]|uniref:anthranilate synthase n=1 Tax=Methanolobus zinderi TaxID=536044 RepID=A0A7D5IR04_9EURY|nr:aminodeoxychorismate/anthranilate synthase component II [Methanolobus zinderi]QLC50907.1 aminodeoxychorismate/anthranilate synthase component II [Methanolobus zinderi]
MKVLFINNKDSFVWNLVDYVSIFEPDTVVVPNTISLEEVRELDPDAIIVSPGPGTPHKTEDIGTCLDIIREFGPKVPVLGVCLGHQAINTAFGGSIGHAKGGPVHGKTSDISHEKSPIFLEVPDNFKGGRYHSLAIEDLADCLRVTAKTEDDIIMAIEHSEYPVYGVQFHPESILTKEGMYIIENFLKIAMMHKD